MPLDIRKRFGTDAKREIEGTTVDLGEGASVTVARWNNARHRAALDRLRRPYRSLLLAGRELPEDVSEAIGIEAMAETILLDWQGFIDESGQPLAHSREAAQALLTEVKDFRDQIAFLALQAENFRVDALEQAEKN